MPGKKTRSDDASLRLRLQDLQVFIQAIELGGMRKAANQLGISQPFVTQTIKKVEETFGVPLIERTRSGIEATIYGKALLKRGLIAFDELNQTINDIKSLGDATTGDVRFSAPQGVGSVIFANVVAEFIEKNPNASVHVSVETSLQDGLIRLRNRYTDFVIGALPRPLHPAFEIDDLRLDRVVEDEIGIIVGKKHPLLRQKTIRPTDLANQKWILPPKDEWYHDLLVKWFKAEKLVLPSPSVVTSSAPVVAKLVSAGQYVAIRSRLFARYHDLQELKCTLPSTKFSWSIITIKGRTLSPIVERFIDVSRNSLKIAAKAMRIG
jgi:DNA-binding transcriptional LysR family regulator